MNIHRCHASVRQLAEMNGLLAVNFLALIVAASAGVIVDSYGGGGGKDCYKVRQCVFTARRYASAVYAVCLPIFLS